MPNRRILTLTVLTLAWLMFISSSETAATLEHRIRDYLNPTYISMVLTAFVSVAIGVFCLLDLHSEAEKRVKEIRKEKN